MMGEVHLLPGTTFSNIAERGTYDAAAKSAMTLAELETWIAIQIVGVYDAGVHRGLGRPPNVAWEHALAGRPRPPRHPPDEHRFLRDFLPFEHRMIRRDGSWLFNIRYWDPVLTTWMGERMRMPVSTIRAIFRACFCKVRTASIGRSLMPILGVHRLRSGSIGGRWRDFARRVGRPSMST